MVYWGKVMDNVVVLEPGIRLPEGAEQAGFKCLLPIL